MKFHDFWTLFGKMNKILVSELRYLYAVALLVFRDDFTKVSFKVKIFIVVMLGLGCHNMHAFII